MKGDRNTKQGMTLVEVAICLGLVSFALISMLGLLPTGMATLREARSSTAEGNYLQSLNAEYLSLGFLNIPQSKIFYFDQDGQRVDSSDPWKRYLVTVEAVPPEYPGMPSGIENSLRRFMVTSRQDGNTSAPARIRFLNIADGGF